MLASTEAFKHICVERLFKCDATVIASPPRLRRLLTNLLTNAMESGAQVIQVRVRAGRDWRAGAHRLGFRITIADNGHGVPREHYQQLFQPFFTTKAERGTGLGLWASRAIVLRNDGMIKLRSAVEGKKRGTCVRIFLPTTEPRVLTFSSKQALRTGSYWSTLCNRLPTMAGPPAMVAAMRRMLTEAGVDEDDIRTEEVSGYWACASGGLIASPGGAVYQNVPEFRVIDHYTYAMCSDGDLMEGIFGRCLFRRHRAIKQSDVPVRQQPHLDWRLDWCGPRKM
jgi:hypothetical protein